MDKKINIAVLTSSRADYGIYLPLLKVLNDDDSIDLKMLVFGTHLSQGYGNTIRQIEKNGFRILFKAGTVPQGDKPGDISMAMAETIRKFIPLWNSSKIDLLFALGDRYEMFAAVTSALPYNIPVAHIHGGETTLGVIDNSFRHSITSMAKYHFTTNEIYKERVIEIVGERKNVFNVGALSIDNLKSMELLSISEMKRRFSIDFSTPTILLTFHPETIDFQQNVKHLNEIISALDSLSSFQQVITMPNADTMGLYVRHKFEEYSMGRGNVHCVESFGTRAYLSAIKYSEFMVGNSSSGFVEASYFAKPVLNLGNRQSGRIITPNIRTVPILSQDILDAVKNISHTVSTKDCRIYGDGTTARKILKIVKNIFLYD